MHREVMGVNKDGSDSDSAISDINLQIKFIATALVVMAIGFGAINYYL